MILELRRAYSHWLAFTAGLSRAHIIGERPAVSVDSRADVKRNKAWSTVPARLQLGREGWEAVS